MKAGQIQSNLYVRVCICTAKIGGILSQNFCLLTVKDCGPLSDPDNGIVDTSFGTTFGSRAAYTCDTGYKLFGSPLRTCGAFGLWTPTQPHCDCM